MQNESAITYFAETDARNKRVKFGIKAADRTKHVYVIGKTGMGKSTLLENMAVQDIQNGEGLAFIDPHGKTADLLLDYIPEHRKKDVVFFAPFDLDYPLSFNVLEQVDADKRHLVVSGLMSTFKKIWQDAWSARMEYILTNTLLALLEYPGATLLGVNRMYADKEFRKDVIAHITDPTVKAFWTEEFAKYTDKFAAEATPAIQNKIGQFTSNALIRNMIGQPKSSFDLRKILDEKKIMIINLSKGRVGEQNANLLGGMLITKIYLAAMSRADATPAVMRNLPQFYLYVDEFQSFANESFADILSEARKYKLNLTMAHQYIEQMEEEVRAAVFGNVGTMIVFRVGAYDAEVLEKEFSPTFVAEDIVNLGQFQMYLKLMIDGVSSSPFSARSQPPIALPEKSLAEDVKALSRSQFAHPRAEVEKTIADWLGPIKGGVPIAAGISAAAASVAPISKPPVQGNTAAPAPRPAQNIPRPVPPAAPAPAPSVSTPLSKPAYSPVPTAPLSKSAPAPASSPAPVPPAPRQEFRPAPKPQIPVQPQSAPRPQEQSKPFVAPQPKPQPEIKKPFAEAFKAMQTETSAQAPEKKAPEAPKQSETSKPPEAAKPQPVSLSKLEKKPAPANNNAKIATPERINDLKAALAKAMGQSAPASAAPKESAPMQKSQTSSEKPQIPVEKLQLPPEKPPVIIPAAPAVAPVSLSQKNPEPQKPTGHQVQTEVPEDVLRKTLGLD